MSRSARRRVAGLAVTLALLLITAFAQAQTPTVFSYQGRLLSNDATQAPVDGTIDVNFSIWSGPTGDGSAVQLWSESWTGVTLTNGVFSVLLGSNGSPLDPADFQGDTTLFLELEIDGETLTPRQQLGAVPFAVVDEPANERQDVTLTGDSLQLTDSTAAVDLSAYLDNTDNQALSLSGNSLQLTSDDGTDTVDLSPLDNAPQDLELDGGINLLSLSDDPTPVDLTSYLDNTDNQILSLSGNNLQLSSDDGTDTVDLSPLDNAPQDLSLDTGTDTLSLSEDPTPVDLSGYLDNTDNQALTITGTDLRLTSDDGDDIVSLAGIGLDDQMLTLSGTDLRLTSDDGDDVVDLSTIDTDNQVLSLSGTNLTLTSQDGTDSVSLAPFLDNTDSQTLALVGNTLSISGTGSTVNLASVNTDTQTLNLSGSTLFISGSGSSVDLSAINTDNQDLDSVLANGTNANNRNIANVNDFNANDISTQTLDCPGCVHTGDIAQDTIGGNDIQDNIFILHIECNGSCNDMSMREACDVIEQERGLSMHTELIGVSCVHGVPSTSGNGFVDCDDGTGTIGDNECRAFNLRTLGDIPCIDGNETDAIVTCLLTDIPR